MSVNEIKSESDLASLDIISQNLLADDFEASLTSSAMASSFNDPFFCSFTSLLSSTKPEEAEEEPPPEAIEPIRVGPRRRSPEQSSSSSLSTVNTTVSSMSKRKKRDN
ncbi:hypothetical protein Goarm_006559 [Gossypium armourianum]|uniref:Uncharacterized protein n=1 Tax=Gossypium armourianum TaxID=34283 RepID=A0A7J9JK57_9ROSI|nr:hypothetical protein [Gossypium armourianum]